MALDGGMLRMISSEIKEALESRIEKIYQPSGEELVILLRKKGFSERLLISVRSGAARVHFTRERLENPETPPMFCMLFRKHFTGAKLISIEQQGFERVLELSFEAINEMGDKVNLKIVCELIGNQSNLILLNNENRIIDALRRSDLEAKRLIIPGAVYEYPEAQSKLSIIDDDIEKIKKGVVSLGEVPLWKGLLNTLAGLSPLVSRELSFRVNCEEVFCKDVNEDILKSKLIDFKNEFSKKGTPCLLREADNSPMDFSYMEIMQYGNCLGLEKHTSYSELLDTFFSGKEAIARRKKLSSDISKLLSNLISRAKRRQEFRKAELKSCENRESLRIYGELIKANIYAIPTGSNKVSLQNFYDEELKYIDVPLDPALNAAGNAAKYFKEYKKSCVAATTLLSLIEKDSQEIEYLQSVEESLSRCEGTSDIAEIREELRLGGYIKSKGNSSKKKNKTMEFKEYQSLEGYKILVGKNNSQNDYITTRLAEKNDLWFHTKGIHGSHVVVFCGGKEVSEETIVFAATLAAKNSKGALSSNVPVDYTYIKNVKKPSGARPGMVIYTTNKTVFVTAEEAYD